MELIDSIDISKIDKELLKENYVDLRERLEENKLFPCITEKLGITDTNVLFTNLLLEYYKDSEKFSKIPYIATVNYNLSDDFINVLKPTFIELMRYILLLNENRKIKEYTCMENNNEVFNMSLKDNKVYLNDRELWSPEAITSKDVFNIAMSLTGEYMYRKNNN